MDFVNSNAPTWDDVEGRADQLEPAERAFPSDRYDPTTWTVELPPFRQADLPHPLEVARRHPPRVPKYLPGRDRRDAGVPRPAKPMVDWGTPKLVAAADAGAVRIGMNWRKAFPTSAEFCFKAGRTMFFEGPHEPASHRLRVVTHTCTDVQFQPLVAHWRLADGTSTSYFVDSVEETDTGWLVFRENKAHRAYFDDPEIDAKLSAFEAEITKHPYVRFERELGSDLMDGMKWRVVKDIYDDRDLVFTDAQRDAVRNVLAREGGVAALGRIWDAIGGDRDDARRLSSAMLVARIIGFPVDRPPAADTRVVMPRPPAWPGRLRRFLRSFAPGAGK